MNVKLPAVIDLDGRDVNPAHIAFFLPAKDQATGEPDPSRTLVVPLSGRPYSVALRPEEAANRAKFAYLPGDDAAFNPAAGFRVRSTNYGGAATRISLWDNDGLFQNLKSAPAEVARLLYGPEAELIALNRTTLPKSQVTVVLPYQDREGRGFQAEAVLDNGKRVRTQEDVATVAQKHGFHYLDEGNIAARPGADIEITAVTGGQTGKLKTARSLNARIAWGNRGPGESVLVEASRGDARRVLIQGLPKTGGEPEPDAKIREQARARAGKSAALKAEGPPSDPK